MLLCLLPCDLFPEQCDELGRERKGSHCIVGFLVLCLAVPNREESDEIERAVQGRARISGDEVEIWICEAALPRTAEERASAVRDLRLGQSVSQSSEAADSERVDEGWFDGRRRRQEIQVEG